MNKKLMIALPLLFLLCFGLVGQVLAQTRVPGVTFGDNLIYSITSSWSTSNASATVPAYLVQINDTRVYNVTVTYVIDDNVTALNIWSFTNGTDIISRATVNTDSGELLEYIPGLPAFQGFYDANLGVNELLYPSGNYSITINQTVTRDYASGKRDTNVLTVSNLSYLGSDLTNSTLVTTTINQYMDKATGVLVERTIFTEYPDQNWTELWTLKSTNLWAVSATPLETPLPLPIIVAIVAIIVVVIIAAVYFRGKRHRRKKFRR
jgi:hypothetical protein